MAYDILAIAAHPDDIEVAMGGTAAKLAAQEHRLLMVDLSDGEPARHAAAAERRKQAEKAAQILGVDRTILDLQDRFIQDTLQVRLHVAYLIRKHQPKWVFSTTDCGVHPDHKVVRDITDGAIFYSRLPNWDKIPGGEILAKTEPWEIDGLFFYY